jgi:enamine deaminase RidA (YjgF/YER057c/UK114 family)
MVNKKYGMEIARDGDFGQMCAELSLRAARGEERGETVVRLVFFGDHESDERYAAGLAQINAAVTQRFGERRPVVTYVAQKPLEGGLAVEITSLERDAEQGVKVRYGGDNYLVIERGTDRELILGGVAADGAGRSVEAQSEQIFGKIRRILDAEGFPVNGIIRQWNYIEGITDVEGGRQRYQDFNDARSRFYAGADWSKGYPAATGIGTCRGGVIVELAAMSGNGDMIDIPLDNSLQVAAHCYSQRVLVGAEGDDPKGKTTPKFERARLTGYPDRATIHISGTAAIRGEGSLAESDAEGQTRATMENVEFLCSPGNVNLHARVVTGTEREFALLRVYVKRPDDLDAVKGYMEGRYAGVPTLYLRADVCRPELLVEIEGIAYIKK